MAQTMKNVKAISIPVNGTDKVVKKIEDANGNIIWGSQAAFPYRRLDYIESTGTQYIDTNQSSTSSGAPVGIKLDFAMTSVPSSQQAFGSLNNVSGQYYRHHSQITSSFNYWVNQTNYQNIASTDTNRHTLEVNYDLDGKIKYDDVEKATGASTISNDNLNYFLFARNNSGTAGNFCSMKVYSCYMKLSNATVYLIPCQRKSDSAIGMLKIFVPTSGSTIYAFRANAGTGTFSYGSVTDEYWNLTI